MIINEHYLVPYAEFGDGVFEKEIMQLIEIIDYKDKKVYVFKSPTFDKIVSYNYNDEKIDWDFMNEINIMFGVA